MKAVTMPKQDLFRFFDLLIQFGFTVIGPKVKADVVVLEELEGFHELPLGFRDRQGPGSYRLTANGGEGLFSFSVGPDSFKRFLHPSVREEYLAKKSRSRIQVQPAPKPTEERRLAFFGMRACDVAALKLLDKVFLEGPIKDRCYEAARRLAFVVVVHCVQPGDHCFCHALGTGPEADGGFDIALTELEDCFLVEIASEKGKSVLQDLGLSEAGAKEKEEKARRLEQCAKRMPKTIPAKDVPRLIANHPDHPRWAETAARCLGCGNCTQVCPTCFCTTAHDDVPLAWLSKKAGEVCATRVRTWDSCFSINFARVHGGNFRPSRRARFRHWLSHKLAYWVDQFGTLGCVGCGRCITWCPVGIDLTEEWKALASARSAT